MNKLWDRIKSLFTYEEEELETLNVPVRGENGPPPSLSMGLANASGHEIVVMKPTSFQETLLAVHCLKNRSTLIVNVNDLSKDESQRFIDFISGSAYALDGFQERVGEEIYILTPSHVGIRSNQALVTADGLVARN
jgi:cell division inhibitor SepF